LDDKQNQFLAREYAALWRAYGIAFPLLPYPWEPEAPVIEATEPQVSPAATNPLPETAPPVIEAPQLEAIRRKLGHGCGSTFCRGRKNLVFGEGNPNARLVFIGEAPSPEEDEQGRVLVGKAGMLLAKIIEAMGFKTEDVYVANLVKCHTGSQKAPDTEQVEHCLPFLQAQLEAIAPEVIVSLGGLATQALVGPTAVLSVVRGRFQSLIWNPRVAVLPTYNPTYLLRNAEAKKAVWEDMKLVMARLAAPPA